MDAVREAEVARAVLVPDVCIPHGSFFPHLKMLPPATDTSASTTILQHPKGEVHVARRPDGRATVKVLLFDPATFSPRPSCETDYPISLLEHILERKGPAYLCDEIARDQDPAYTEATLRPDLLAYVAPEEFAGKRLLDFGCGSGASTMILARLLPHTEIIGVELSEQLLETARLRADHYRLPNLRFLKSPSGDTLPPEMGSVDFIVMSAVFEHLLPVERRALLPLLWSALKPGGVMFVDQTPHRWFPIEHHTTYLPLLNYLPDRLANFAAKRFSKLVRPNDPWSERLRDGIRGGTAGEVMRLLSKASGGRAELLKPQHLGITNEVDLWYAGSTFHSYPRARRWIRTGAKALRAVTGISLVPYISVAMRKAE